jgi:hypothetical protein
VVNMRLLYDYDLASTSTYDFGVDMQKSREKARGYRVQC